MIYFNVLALLNSCSEQSAVSHCITWKHDLHVKEVAITGAKAFAVSGSFPRSFAFVFFTLEQSLGQCFSSSLLVLIDTHFTGTPADCASLGVSKALFPVVPDLVLIRLQSM